jgi:hypothetical protein
MKRDLFLGILVVAILWGCKKNAPTPVPVTCGSVNVDSAAVGQQILFFNCTKGATHSLWNFGDDSTSTLDTVYHIYFKPGTYAITLTTSNGGGSGVVKTFAVVVIASEFWSFKGTNYYAPSLGPAFGSSARYVAAEGSYTGSAISSISMYIGDDTISNYAGLDTVVNIFPPARITEALVHLNIGSQSYNPDTANGIIQKVQVNIVNGKASFIGNNIKLVGANATDTGSISFNLSQ